MKKMILAVLLMASFQVCAEGKWELSGSGDDVELRQKYNYDYNSRFRGSMDDDGSVRLRNFNGETLRGNVDSDGYGYLRNDDGDRIRVRPR